MNKFILILLLFIKFLGYTQCPNNLNGNNNNPTYVTVYVYNSNFIVIDTIQCNTNPSGQVNCDLTIGSFYSIQNTQCLYDNNGILLNTYLPIELLTFEGYNKNENNILTWSTASENDNDYFTLERSEDGVISNTYEFIM